MASKEFPEKRVLLRWALYALAALAVLYLAINWPRWTVRAQVATG